MPKRNCTFMHLQTHAHKNKISIQFSKTKISIPLRIKNQNSRIKWNSRTLIKNS
jgi:hypothetical protein